MTIPVAHALDLPRGLPRTPTNVPSFEETDARSNLPPPAIRRAVQAMAHQRIAPASIVVLGSSTTEGHGVTTQARRWLDQVKPLLRADPGGGHVPAGRVNTFAGYPVTLSNGASISASTGESTGWAGRSAVLRDADDTITFTFTGTSFRLAYGQYSGGPTLSVVIDGAAAQTINTGSPATTDRYVNWTSPALARGAHTVVVTRSSGTAYAYVRAFDWFDGDETTGVRIYDGGHAGWTTADYLADIAQWGPGIPKMLPDLVVLQLGANDVSSGRTAAAWVADMQNLMSQINALAGYTPAYVILLTAAAGSATPNTALWEEYRRAAFNIGGVGVLDVSEHLPGPGAVDTRYVTGDNTHLDDEGHSALAALFADMLTPASVSGRVPDVLRIADYRILSGPTLPEGNVAGRPGDHYLYVPTTGTARTFLKETGLSTTTGWQQLAEMQDITADTTQPPPGWWKWVNGILSGTAATLTSTINGQQRFMPIDVGPFGFNVVSLGMYVTAVHAGTQPTIILGLYPSNREQTLPVLTGGPLLSGTITTATTGLREATGNVALAPGRYWLSVFYLNTGGTAPTTYPSTTIVSNNLFPCAPSWGSNLTSLRWYAISGLSAPSTAANPTWVSASDSLMPLLGFRRAA